VDETVILRFRRREPASHRKGRERGSVLRSAVRAIGEAMITMGLVLLLFAAYEIWGKSVIVNEHQRDLDSQLTQQWAQTPGPSALPVRPPPGGSIARLFIPRLGKHWVVVEGVSEADIAYAPGHYPNTALPGQVGNFSVAGHRTPAIWWDLDRVRVGDKIVAQTRTAYYIYTVSSTEIVDPTAIQVVAPVPDHPGDQPTVAMLTLTTCNPKWDNYQRLVVHARLDQPPWPAGRGAPPEIAGS
jgi:sortase A